MRLASYRGMEPLHHPERANASRWRWLVAVSVAFAVFFVWTDHRAHLESALPFLVVAACLLVQMFHEHHRGGGHGKTT